MMIRKTYWLLFSLLIILIFPVAAAQAPKRLTAPTLYIVGSTEYGGMNWLYLRGASNLPPGSRLAVNIFDFIGEGAKPLNQEIELTVGKNGLFEAKLLPRSGVVFHHNMVGDIVFMPTYPKQDAAILAVVGKNGDKLGFETGNPQAKVVSGGYYLDEMIHIP